MTAAQMEKLTPDQVCAAIKKRIRDKYGDHAENISQVYASHGFYHIVIQTQSEGRDSTVEQFNVNKRKNDLPAFFKEMTKAKRVESEN